MHTVLILEPDPQLADRLASLLRERNMYVVICHFLESAFRKIERYQFDIALIATQAPDGNAFHLIEFLHQESFQTRTILLSSHLTAVEKIKAFTSGADDYLAKPLDYPELLAKIEILRFRRKVFKRAGLQLKDQVQLYPEEGLLYLEQKKITLRRREAQILHCLFLHKDQVVTRDMLLQWVWGAQQDIPKAMTLDVYIKRIRLAMGAASLALETTRGFGYRLNSAYFGSR